MLKENELSIFFYYFFSYVFSVVTELQILAKQPTYFSFTDILLLEILENFNKTKFFVVAYIKEW